MAYYNQNDDGTVNWLDRFNAYPVNFNIKVYKAKKHLLENACHPDAFVLVEVDFKKHDDLRFYEIRGFAPSWIDRPWYIAQRKWNRSAWIRRLKKMKLPKLPLPRLPDKARCWKNRQLFSLKFYFYLKWRSRIQNYINYNKRKRIS